MEIEIIKQKDVPLLNRKRVIGKVQFEGSATPSISVFKDLVASALNVQKDLIAIRHVYTHFGVSIAKVIVHVYKSREDLLRLERLKKVERKEQEAANVAVSGSKKEAVAAHKE